MEFVTGGVLAKYQMQCIMKKEILMENMHYENIRGTMTLLQHNRK